MESNQGWGRRAAVTTVAALTAVGCSVAGASATTPNGTPTPVVRIAGGDAVGTAVAASQHDWTDAGKPQDANLMPAKAVVLSRSDTFSDALAGSDLAVDVRGPLLLTPSGGVDPLVMAEIQRILPTSAPIYLLGGTSALSPVVADQLIAAGYKNLVRLAGSNVYGTAVAIDDELDKLAGGPTTTLPCNVIIVRGDTYYDAMSAGAVAGYDSEYGGCPTAMVLSDGDTLPPASLAYLTARSNPTDPDPGAPAGGSAAVVAIGGPAATAYTKALAAGELPFWKQSAYTSLVGANATATALDVAKRYYSGADAPSQIAVATDATWQDALSGGAFVTSHVGLGGPLLLTSPDGLDAADAAYLATFKDKYLYGVYVMGGPAALPDSIADSIQTIVNGG